MKKVILFGATGMQGTAIAKQLQKEGYHIIAPVRTQEKVDLLAKYNVEACITDFSFASLEGIAQKADEAVLLVPAVIPTADMVPFTKNALSALKEANISRIVFNISSVIPDKKTGIAGPDTRLEMKEVAFKIIPTISVTSSTLYLENFSTAYRQAILEQGNIPQAVPADVPIAYMSMDDLGKYVTAILKDNSLEGQFFPIGGKEALTGTEVAAQLSEIIGQSVNYFALQPEQLIGFLSGMLGEALATQVGEMYAWEGTTGKNKLYPNTTDLREHLGLDLPSFKDWAKHAFNE
ncbi:MAG: NmrA family NAD(P)-binding protein [Bacteroidota bacterium]